MSTFLNSDGGRRQGLRQWLYCGPAESLTGGEDQCIHDPWATKAHCLPRISSAFSLMFKFQSFSNSLTNLDWTRPGILIFFIDQLLAPYTLSLSSNSEPVPRFDFTPSFGCCQLLLCSHTYFSRLRSHSWENGLLIFICALFPLNFSFKIGKLDINHHFNKLLTLLKIFKKHYVATYLFSRTT